MSKQAKRTSKPTDHTDIARALRAAPPEMDDLRHMRLERRLLASVEQGAGAPSVAPRAPSEVLPLRRVLPSARFTMGVLALAAAAMLGYLLPGGIEDTSTNSLVEGAHFALIRAEVTTDGLLAQGRLAEGANVATHAGERGSVEVGDVTAHLAERTTLSLESDDANDVAMRLESGSTEFAFHPHQRGAQHLTVTTPNARVEVVGTVFTVRVDGAGTEVSVSEGTVRVVRLNGGESSLVYAGETLLVRSVTSSAHASAITPRVNQASSTPAIRAPTVEAVTSPAAPLSATRVLNAREPSLQVARIVEASALVAEVALVQVDEPAAEASAVPEAVATPELVATSELVATPEVAAPEQALALAAPRPNVSRARSAQPSAATSLASPRARRAEVVTRGPQLSQPPTEFAHERRVWGRVDDLQSNGQYEQSLPLLIAIENEGAPGDRAEALYHRARTLDVALHRSTQAVALYRRYLETHPSGARAREAYLRIGVIESQ